MAQVSITIPDAVLSRVLDAIATAYSYNSATDGTKAQFARRQLALWVMNTVRSVEANLAAETSRQTALTRADAEVVVT